MGQQFTQKIIINGDEYEISGNIDFSNLTIKTTGIEEPDPTNPDKPTEGIIKEGGWNANITDKNAWKVVAMKDNPALWKIVDAVGKNVATEFSKKEIAESFIAYFKTHPFPPEDTNVPTPPTPPDQPPVTGTGDGPYPQKVGSKTLQSEQRGPTTRHYASGKPDDETIEKNVKDIPYRNYQWVVETTIKEMEHDDTISLKFGGQHTTGNGWWDCGVGIYDGQTCLGSEPHHPSTNLCVVKGPKIGDIRNKKIKIAGVFFEENDHIELWTNLGDGWKKQVEGDHIDNLKPDHSKGHETQERIDGFKKGSVPELHFAVVQEIDPKSGTVPTPPPPVTPPTPPIEPPVVTPPPPPPVTGSGTDKYGTKLLISDGKEIQYDVKDNFRDDGKRFDLNVGDWAQSEATGYFRFTRDPVDDEVSIKWSEMSHSGSNDVNCYDSGVSIKDGKARLRFENPHPNYSNSLGSGQGSPLGTKWIGYKGTKTVSGDTVTIKLYQDTGNNEGLTNPANEWKEIFSYTDSKYKRTGAHPYVTLRIDDPAKEGQKNLEGRWISVAKI
jgi:hypothetical protein